ncbi:hypothetical protein CTEN210_01599 [Chaetoceros tenuissimus]|uniref:Uncharacterized protein n=1 Tax=Chaetoceros tenuissimus TaxID=426638 RepID=A0AAD3GZT9_9STRA|nr:hypothetical protein CTEN210_01599 [Chaetoceros tenuissimus]
MFVKPVILAIAIKTCSSSIIKEEHEQLKSTHNLLHSSKYDIENPYLDHYCINDDSFSFIDGNGESRDCSWLLHETDSQRKSKFCSLKLIKTNCERSCDACTCQDDKSFTFLVKEASSANKNMTKTNVGCKWLAGSKDRQDMYCFLHHDESILSDIGHHCPLACGSCSSVHPSSTSSSSLSSSSLSSSSSSSSKQINTQRKMEENMVCVNSPEGWHDIDGSAYTCEWYSTDNRCNDFGSVPEYANFGFTANEACCGCGGGELVPKDTIGQTCQDTQGWFDKDGEAYNCEWYSHGSNCEQYGFDLSTANFGETAGTACCICGGGCTDVEGWHGRYNVSESFDCAWYAQGDNCQLYGSDPNKAFNGLTASEACCACNGGNRVALPTPAPVENVCVDTPGWYDKDGEAFGCSWYANGDNCQKYGFDMSTVNFGAIASTACCNCGGGCTDVEGWHGRYNVSESFDCAWYAQGDNCQLYGSDPNKAFNGLTASTACCICGGGNKVALPTPAPVENVCIDTPGWHDKDGEAFGCSWYEHGSNCLQYGFNRDTENFGLIASEACCICGGGCTDVEGWRGKISEHIDYTFVLTFVYIDDHDCNWYAQSDNCALFGNDSSKERFGYIANSACCACGRIGTELPSDEYYCEDFPSGWHDIDGPDYDCNWYSTGNNCEVYGSGSAKDGHVANDACCACGGGLSDSERSVGTNNLITEMECEDSPLGWYDKDGSDFDCAWYANDNNCQMYGSVPEATNFGKTASEACCICGGGMSEKTPSAAPSRAASMNPTMYCEDSPLGWHDADGEDYDCDWYYNSGFCNSFGIDPQYAWQGKTAKQACCKCGGGMSEMTPSAAPSMPTSSTFDIHLVNTGDNDIFDHYFEEAKARWESVLIGDLQDIPPQGIDWFYGKLNKEYKDTIDDIVIGYQISYIDGPGLVLGRAAPLYFRQTTGSPISGYMEFDFEDLATMAHEDIEVIILHEMGHVLGLVGTLGQCNNNNCQDFNYKYPCTKAQSKFREYFPRDTLMLESSFGSGTSCTHWDEENFPHSLDSSELMTGVFEEDLEQPLSDVTLAALEDMFTDYVVDYEEADAYPPLSARRMLEEEGETDEIVPMKQHPGSKSGWKVVRSKTTFNTADLMEDPGIDPIPIDDSKFAEDMVLFTSTEYTSSVIDTYQEGDDVKSDESEKIDPNLHAQETEIISSESSDKSSSDSSSSDKSSSDKSSSDSRSDKSHSDRK